MCNAMKSLKSCAWLQRLGAEFPPLALVLALVLALALSLTLALALTLTLTLTLAFALTLTFEGVGSGNQFSLVVDDDPATTAAVCRAT